MLINSELEGIMSRPIIDYAEKMWTTSFLTLKGERPMIVLLIYLTLMGAVADLVV